MQKNSVNAKGNFRTIKGSEGQDNETWPKEVITVHFFLILSCEWVACGDKIPLLLWRSVLLYCTYFLNFKIYFPRVSSHKYFKKGTICMLVLLLLYFYQFLIADYDLFVTILQISMIFALYCIYARIVLLSVSCHLLSAVSFCFTVR